MRPPIDNGTILITGASAGLGSEFARQLAPRAHTLVLVARRVSRLAMLHDELQRLNPKLAVHLEPCDLSDPQAADAMIERVHATVGAVDVLVNNAGLGDQTLYERSDWQRIQQIIQVNVVALALLTHRFLPAMVARGRGGILNISSGAGIALIPGAAAYTGSKHFVTAFTETLAMELVDTGVIITQSCPGPVDTEFDEAAGIAGMTGGPPPFVRISAEQCVRESLAGFDRGEPLVFPGLIFRQMMRALAVVPRATQRRTGRATARKLRSQHVLRTPMEAQR